MFENGCDLLAGNAGKPSKEIIDASPPSRFSKRALTGTRVPRNSQAPLTLSGSRSTTEQLDQSNMVLRLSRLRQTNNPILDAFAHSSLRALNRCAVPFQCFLKVARQGRVA